MGRIEVDRRSRLATVTMRNDGKLNAMSRDMWVEFASAWKELGADDSVRCVVLTGGGSRGFCPGNDISEFDKYRSNSKSARELSATMNAGRQAMLDCPHPIVAKIRGACVGGGLEIAAMCDMRICSEGSRFGAPLNRIGLTMAYEEMLPIWRITDKATLFEFLVEGRIIDANDAKLRGIVNRVVAEQDLDVAVDETVTSIVEGPPLVNRWHKKFFKRLEHEPALTREDFDEHFLSFETEDYSIGYHSFLMKSKPKFFGR